MMTRMAHIGSPPALGYECVIATDLGTHGTGVAILFPTKECFESTLAVRNATIFRKPGKNQGVEKELTALLYACKESHAVVAVGEDAQCTFVEVADKGDSADGMQYELYKGFKMALAADSPERKACTCIMDVQTAALATVNCDNRPVYMPVLKLMKDMLMFVKEDTQTHLTSRYGHPPARTLWVLTVPAIWDDEAKALMRRAAFEAGLVSTEHSPDLVLALEPECAIIAAIAGYSDVPLGRDDAAIVKAGMVAMVVDCGGGTVDVTVEKVACLDPVEMEEVYQPSGGPWGVSMVKRQFVDYLKTVFTDKLYPFLQHTTLLQLQTEWDLQIRTLGRNLDMVPPPPVRLTIQTVLLEFEEALAKSPDVVFDAKVEFSRMILDVHNAKVPEEQRLRLTKTGCLDIPAAVALTWFESSLNAICSHLKRVSSAVHVDAIVLAGGYAENEILRRRICAAFPDMPVSVPLRPSTAVAAGAALYVCHRHPIRSRRMRYSYGYLQATMFDRAIHDEEFRYIVRGVDGRERVMINVIFPIVQVGDDVAPGHEFVNDDLIPVSHDQSEIQLQIYRLPYVIPDPRRGEERQCVPVSSVKNMISRQRTTQILPATRVATLKIQLKPPVDAAPDARRVTLKLRFDAVEIQARAFTHESASEEASVHFSYGSEGARKAVASPK